MRSLFKASGWSVLTELIAKVISPISFLVLTKILSPEDFGIVAVATTFISFVQIISDLGISKFVIQESWFNDDIKRKSLNTCFWFNLLLGTVIFLLCFVFSYQIAGIFGKEESGLVIRIMSLQILFFSLSSLQSALLKKDLNFKFLFYLRLITIAMPILISIPIAFLGGGYWAIVWGNFFGALLNLLILWKFSTWRPQLSIDRSILRKVLGKGVWGSFDELLVWIPLGLDAYLIGNYFSSRDLGLYTTSRTLFAAAIAITLGAVLPVLFSHLSRIKDNHELFIKTILDAQKVMYALAGFVGAGVFLYSDLIELIFFNQSWKGISKVLGIIFFIMSNSYFYSVLQEALRAKGFFKELFYVKFSSIFIIVPLLFFAINYDIYIYSVIRCLVLYLWVFGIFYWSKKLLNINLVEFLKNSGYLVLVFIVLFAVGLIIDNATFVDFYSKLLLKTIFFIVAITLVCHKEREFIRRAIDMVKKK